MTFADYLLFYPSRTSLALLWDAEGFAAYNMELVKRRWWFWHRKHGAPWVPWLTLWGHPKSQRFWICGRNSQTLVFEGIHFIIGTSHCQILWTSWSVNDAQTSPSLKFQAKLFVCFASSLFNIIQLNSLWCPLRTIIDEAAWNPMFGAVRCGDCNLRCCKSQCSDSVGYSYGTSTLLYATVGERSPLLSVQGDSGVPPSRSLVQDGAENAELWHEQIRAMFKHVFV